MPEILDWYQITVFWMYNSLNTIIFHSFWKMQSDVWGIYNTQEHSVAHISSCGLKQLKESNPMPPPFLGIPCVS